MPQRSDSPSPAVSPWLLGWFLWYVRRYLRKSFHSVALLGGEGPCVPLDAPLVVYMNHASWWDPLVAMHLAAAELPGKALYAPFDAEALARYPVFERLGFFGVEQETRRGAAAYLRTSRDVLARPGGSLWITPEGRFVDPRDEAVAFKPGLAHVIEDLAASNPSTVVLPLAIEYPFWEERLPEALAAWGEPIVVADHAGLDKGAWDALLRERLRATQGALSQASIARNAAAFRVLLGGAEGVGGPYEGWRKLIARATGRRYQPNHSDKLRLGGAEPPMNTEERR
ncbi:MAG: lysophospholipid acyltransferase family protein [Lacipirellulaceae bacterium]